MLNQLSCRGSPSSDCGPASFLVLRETAWKTTPYSTG